MCHWLIFCWLTQLLHNLCVSINLVYSPSSKLADESWLTSGRPSLLKCREIWGLTPLKSLVVAVNSSPSAHRWTQQLSVFVFWNTYMWTRMCCCQTQTQFSNTTTSHSEAVGSSLNMQTGFVAPWHCLCHWIIGLTCIILYYLIKLSFSVNLILKTPKVWIIPTPPMSNHAKFFIVIILYEL